MQTRIQLAKEMYNPMLVGVNFNVKLYKKFVDQSGGSAKADSPRCSYSVPNCCLQTTQTPDPRPMLHLVPYILAACSATSNINECVYAGAESAHIACPAVQETTGLNDARTDAQTGLISYALPVGPLPVGSLPVGGRRRLTLASDQQLPCIHVIPQVYRGRDGPLE